MSKDKILMVGIFGALATIPSEIITQASKVLKINIYSDYELSSLLTTDNRPSVIMGFILEGTVGIIVSILLFCALNRLIQEHTLLKCSYVGIVIWLIEELAMTVFIEGKTIPDRPINDHYAHLIGAIVFGLIVGILLKRYMLEKTK